MSVGRYVAAAGLALSLVLVVAQTGAFSATIADRGVQVTVDDDQSAYLGVETEPVAVPGNATTNATLATMSNRFATTLDVTVDTVDPDDDPPTLREVRGPGSLAAGEWGTASAEITCGDTTTETVIRLVIDARGDDVTVDLDRAVTVTCDGESDDEDASG